jgi:hypothetical protein
MGSLPRATKKGGGSGSVPGSAGLVRPRPECHTPKSMTGLRRTLGSIAAVGLLAGLAGCAQLAAQDKAKQQAVASGKYKVHLTTDAESVEGTCKFVHAIWPDDDPVQIPTNDQLPDYYRVQGVLLGADTVLVRGRTGDAYICGPGPLNPDGTLRTLPPPGPPPSPTPARPR